jgi:signal transduction histidine kinase
MKMSIRASVTLWYCLVFCLSVGLLEAGVYIGLDRAMTSATDKELAVRMNGVIEFLNEHLGRLPLPRVVRELQIHVALQPELDILQDAEGHTLYCGKQVQPLCGSSVEIGTRVMMKGRAFRFHSANYAIKGSHYIVLVVDDLAPQRELLSKFRTSVLLVIPLALLCAALGGYWLSGRAFAPVGEIISAVRSINDQSLSLRLRVPVTGDEIQLLSETLNGMLGRVEASFRQVTELTANASHELRTPATIIRTAAEVALLNTRPTVESYRKALLQISAEAEKNTHLLESLLLLARGDAGVQSLNLVDVNLKQSLGKALAACRYLAEAKQIRLTLHSHTSEPRVFADPVQLNRLWLLLLDNAVKYTPPGGIVTVRVQRSQEGPFFCEITDTGIGIDEADLPKIFHRFFRASNARAQTEVGSGLGLAMVGWIADAHHATVNVSSELGKGSVFRICFPVQEPRRNKIINPNDAETVRQEGRAVGSSGKSKTLFTSK